MKTHKNIYKKIISYENLLKAYKKARLGKSKKEYVIRFEQNLEANLISLHLDLKFKRYYPVKLKRFVIRDPKTRVIHSSIFRDRIVHHAIINIINPIYEKIFIHDSFASRKNKGSQNAINRLYSFARSMSKGKLASNSINNNHVVGYCLKCDIKKYFQSMNHKVLIDILKKKIKDKDFIELVRRILNNYEDKEAGVPLGNYTSQFFGNVYLNQLDYFVKHKLKAKYYIRYVDDFVILDRNKGRLIGYKAKIEKYLTHLKLELHPDKCKIFPIKDGVAFLGYRNFYFYKLPTKRNIKHFKKRLENNVVLLNSGEISQDQFDSRIHGFDGYLKFSNAYRLRNRLLEVLR